MRTLLPWARASIALAMSGPDSVPVVARWVEPGVGAVVDPTTGALESGAAVVGQANTRGFWHEVQETETKYRVFEEVEVGNGVLELPASIELTIAGKKNVEFEILGERWVQKDVGEALKRTWEQWGGEKLVMTLLLRRQT